MPLVGEMYRTERATLVQGDCLDVLRCLEDGEADALVTDPPSGTGFMNKSWDSFKSRDAFVEFLTPRLAECRRVCRPGAVGLVWALPRTSHWTALAVEEAGWVIEDVVCHLFGTGMPKHRSKLKPGHEQWHKVRKPLNLCSPLHIIAESHSLLEAWLWLISPVKLAEYLSSVNGNEERVDPDSALWLVGVQSLVESPEKFDVTATFNSPEEGLIFWSIASLWGGILAESYERRNRFTTEMEISLTTALKTLNYFLSRSMPESIIRAACYPNGLWSSASLANECFQNERRKRQDIRSTSAEKPVTLALLNTLVNIVESLSLTTATINGVTVPVHAPTEATACEEWVLCRNPGPLWLGVEDCRINAGGEALVRPPIQRHGNTVLGQGLGVGTQQEPAGRWPANTVISHHPECVCQGTKKVKGHRFGSNVKSYSKGKGTTGHEGWQREAHAGYANKDPNQSCYADADGTETVENWTCHPDCPIRLLDEQAGLKDSGGPSRRPAGYYSINGETQGYSGKWKGGVPLNAYQDSGGPSRFFANFPAEEDTSRMLYCSKASKKDRGESNIHPTVKSTTLMSWLVKLACPEGGLVLDPFAGSGSTGVACLRTGRRFFGVESDRESCLTAARRLRAEE
jgi:DNA modification methylase